MKRQKKYVHKPFSKRDTIIVCVLLGAFIGVMLFIVFATMGVYEEIGKFNVCKENENLSDGAMWAVLPQCMYLRLQENPEIDVYINVSELEGLR